MTGAKGEYGFVVGEGFNPDFPLVIDPWLDVVGFSTYLGGENHDDGYGIAAGTSGYIYVTGSTSSDWFPTTMGAFDETIARSGYSDAFVGKFYPDGSRLAYSTFIGGQNPDWGNDIAVDSAGNAYVTGPTEGGSSPPFPVTTGAFDTTYGGRGDAFVLKLNPDGSDLVYSTFLGGRGNDMIDCGAGEDLINGRRGSDTITSCDGSADTINGNENTDTCTVDCGTDTTSSCAVTCCP